MIAPRAAKAVRGVFFSQSNAYLFLVKHGIIEL